MKNGLFQSYEKECAFCRLKPLNGRCFAHFYKLETNVIPIASKAIFLCCVSCQEDQSILLAGTSQPMQDTEKASDAFLICI